MLVLAISLLLLFAGCFWVLFTPLTSWSKTKIACALGFSLLSLTALLLSASSREQLQLAQQYDHEQAYLLSVKSYVSGQQIDAENLDAMTFILSLQRYLQSNFRDSNAWMILGNMMQNAQDMRLAMMAYQRAHRVNPHDHTLALAYVGTKLAEAEQKANDALDWEVIEILEMMLTSDDLQAGQYENALMYLGIASFQGRDYQKAEQAWQRLYERLQSFSDVRPVPEAVLASLEASIAQARERYSSNESIKTSEEKLSEFKLEMTVVLSEAAKIQLMKMPFPKQATVFIYARAAGENTSPMPLAAIREPIAHLDVFPLRLTLRQAHALMGKDLNAEARLAITARLSLQGEVKAAQGDWQSESFVYEHEQKIQPIVLNLDKAL